MNAEKLVRQIRKPELNQHDFELTEEEAVALLTRAIEEETQALLCSEQIKHNKIAEICFAVGAETPDGTSTGAVNNLADKYNALRAQVAELREATQRLICKVNKVTAHHRHGAQITIMSLDELSNEQIETEAALARVEAGKPSDEWFSFRLNYKAKSRWEST